ncbi:helix-turn-helix transcriptional regulator [Streptomyces sp. NPDC052299]|uniref:helix-turn-helix transcriptional regulator n=1 Tax=Streptomyces sp. NPDC052299 TaxID=3155054 RepID=UPI00344588A5
MSPAPSGTRHCGHPHTFQRRFKEATGLTATEYVRAARIAKARELLEPTGEQVAQIARDVGYLDVPNFRRLFQRATASLRRSTGARSASRHESADRRRCCRRVRLRESAPLPPDSS